MATIAKELNLTPLAKTVLFHLRKRGSITGMEAMIAYGTMKVARPVHELRTAGYDITSEMRKDEAGHRYTRYTLDARAD